MASLSLEGVVKAFGEHPIIRGVDLSIADGEFVVLVGPSGCGKSTLLRLIAGLEGVTAGRIRIGEHDVSAVGPAKRGVAMVFQSYALYPHMSVAKNLSFGLENLRMDRAEIDRRVGEAARMLEIEPLLQRRPRELSGGQRQRVAIGRAIVRDPSVFLFDEPLSNLDAALRVQTRGEITRLHRRLRTTMVYVTHDQIEAMTMADRIAVMNRGEVEQYGPPLELFDRPANLFVAGFIGSPKMNFFSGRLASLTGRDAEVHLPGFGRMVLPVDPSGLALGDPVTLGVRPSHFEIRAAAAGEFAVPFAVDYAESVGTETYVYGRVAGHAADVVVLVPGHRPVDEGATLSLAVPAERCHLFHGAGGRRISRTPADG
ncbi:ABC transporter ATP-binding protein [Oharaeibacter diazotrophicus]|uniref:Carbohydrate ABC transporter ATP-binding protein (CUT1 family) n=1 Tax=Oharaeibacter diazotrophicus TaxID=1920512 RepID=A0A4R6RKN1_9HYPH|nr:sn-glycerol-3-phosphate ABC transporter ATP-binding protein UgpC [Oharaeibacter diazotrophicus]TDP87221.1 carbohydrate ABC transporter ATP-binding protein (CUT1 family) [Oharaeibacter diazotrophicus]BBE70836.1 maltose/maltodextrin import ATP-binding protein MalK [Pleomorphomonas sp. SM30]GLS77585.1 ABC transporter [Oharaeibacter diazotrophicus]